MIYDEIIINEGINVYLVVIKEIHSRIQCKKTDYK